MLDGDAFHLDWRTRITLQRHCQRRCHQHQEGQVQDRSLAKGIEILFYRFSISTLLFLGWTEQLEWRESHWSVVQGESWIDPDDQLLHPLRGAAVKGKQKAGQIHPLVSEHYVI